MDSKSNDNRNQIKNQPPKLLKNDENQPKDSQQVKKEEEVGIKQKLNDKHIILTPLDGDWQLDGEILDMTIANNILDTMNIKPNDLTDDLIDDCKISSYVPESEWKPTYNPFHPQNWFRTKPQVGKVVIPDINPKLRLFHPFANGIQCWNALYNLFILISFPMIPFTVGDPDFVSLLYILSPLATLFNIINAFVCLNTAKLVDGRFITNRWTLFKNRLLNGGIFLDILTGFPWIFLCEYLGDELLTIYYPDLHGKAVTSGAGNTSGAINYHLPPVYEFESNHMLLKYTICFLHLLLCIRLFDSREIHEWMSIKKLQEKHQISGSLMLAFKVSIYQIWYWNFSVSIQSLIYGKPKELQYSFGVYTYYMEIIATKKLPTPKGADFKVLTVTMNSLLVTFFVILLVTIIASWADELNRPVKTFKARVEEVNQFSNYRGFGMPFRQKLMQYYSFKYYGGVYFDEEHILSQLNTSLHAVIIYHSYSSSILIFVHVEVL
ncbi:hypothetical protein BC833DRAFT_286336 [Globomyces pollinis-pini]|nr:hypothetical protein BC833DRAFT_286336 [Globomyces pollinis-pini]